MIDDVRDGDSDAPGPVLASDVMIGDIHGSVPQDFDNPDLSLGSLHSLYVHTGLPSKQPTH